jgi:hypothetical protein
MFIKNLRYLEMLQNILQPFFRLFNTLLKNTVGNSETKFCSQPSG